MVIRDSNRLWVYSRYKGKCSFFIIEMKFWEFKWKRCEIYIEIIIFNSCKFIRKGEEI